MAGFASAGGRVNGAQLIPARGQWAGPPSAMAPRVEPVRFRAACKQLSLLPNSLCYCLLARSPPSCLAHRKNKCFRSQVSRVSEKEGGERSERASKWLRSAWERNKCEACFANFARAPPVVISISRSSLTPRKALFALWRLEANCAKRQTANSRHCARVCVPRSLAV